MAGSAAGMVGRALVLAVALASIVSAADKTVPGQKPVLLVDGTFRFVQGSWGKYEIQDLAKKETYQMWIAILDGKQLNKNGKKVPYSWLEIAVDLPGQPSVVTRCLVEQTPEGPGELDKVIVQVAGMAAFSVPKRFYEPQDGKAATVAQFQVAKQGQQVSRDQYTVGARSFPAWTLEAFDEAGKPVRAVVSEELPPIGVYRAEAGSTRMTLLDWGTGAKSRIRGLAYPFWLWLGGQVTKAAAEPTGPK
jgi:hypothetical protein